MEPLESTQFLAVPLLAQVGIVSTQLQQLIAELLTPEGIIFSLIGLSFIVAALVTNRGFEFVMTIVLFLLSMMMQMDRTTGALVPLWGPLDLIRNYSRPACVVLLAVAAVRAAYLPSTSRRLTGGTALLFYGFQMYFVVQLALFSDGVKGTIGILTMSLMFVTAALGFGKMMQTADGARRCIACFAWAAIPFIACTFLQVAFGYSVAVQNGRLVGVAGNAQQMASVCSYFLLTTCLVYRMENLHARPSRWGWLAVIAVLAVFQLWTGSRTGLLASSLGLFMMYRLQVGRLAVLVLLAGSLALAVSMLFEDSTANLTRYVEGGDTRSGVFLRAIEEFTESPVIGQLPFARGGDVSGVESSWLRALASMGIAGGAVVLLPFVSMLINALQVRQLDPGRGPLHELSDFYLGAVGALLVTNTFEGLAFGVLTLPVMFMYTSFTLAAYLLDASGVESSAPERAAEPEADGSGAPLALYARTTT